MGKTDVSRRAVLRGVAAGGGAVAVSGRASATGSSLTIETHTEITVRAVVDAVLPETPELAEPLGAEHVPGGWRSASTSS